MSPLAVHILLHYYSCANDFREGDFTAPAVRELIDAFREIDGPYTHCGMLEVDPSRARAYRLTEKGRVYINALLSVPLPVQVWVIPQSVEATC